MGDVRRVCCAPVMGYQQAGGDGRTAARSGRGAMPALGYRVACWFYRRAPWRSAAPN